MNIANIHQTIRQGDRRDVRAAGREEAERIGGFEDMSNGNGVAQKVVRMPGLDRESNQGAQAVIAGYRDEAVEQLIALHGMIGEVVMSPLNTATDEDLNRATLCCEVVVGAIYKYLQVVEAGKTEDGGQRADDREPHDGGVAC